VLPVRVSRAPLGRAEEVARAAGSAAARLALMGEEVPPGLEHAATAAFGERALVVRSSSPLEAFGAWSGAFASYVGVGAADLPTAVRGCWASMFGRDAAERFEELGASQAAAGLAVLVQPAIDARLGGVAEVRDGEVAITVADGDLAAMLQGWVPGLAAVVDADGQARGPAVGRAGASLLGEVARVARACVEAGAGNHLEWAAPGGEVVILQCRTVERDRASALAAQEANPAFAGPLAVDLARAVARFGGRLGEELVLPWVLAPRTGSRHRAAAAAPARLEALRAQAGVLVEQAWGDPGAVRPALEALRERLDEEALARLRSLRPIPAGEGERLVAAVESAGLELARLGALDDATDVWRLAAAELSAFLEEGTVPPAAPPPVLEPWAAVVREVVRANGRAERGAPASEGVGVGRVLPLDEPRRLRGSRQRYVLYVRTPLPGYAPLLWAAAGLVAAGGSAGAHLFDVARSLGVPAVAACDLGDPGEGALALVDGESGEVSLL